MNFRQLKKLCKTSYELIQTPSVTKALRLDPSEFTFDHEEGLHVQWFRCGGYCEEYDMRDTWSLLQDMYCLTFTNFSEEVMAFEGKPPTPSNVFNWARSL